MDKEPSKEPQAKEPKHIVKIGDMKLDMNDNLTQTILIINLLEKMDFLIKKVLERDAEEKKNKPSYSIQKPGFIGL